MIEYAWNFIQEQLQTNQFFTGAALSGILMGAVYQMRSVPLRIWSRIKRYITYSVFVSDEDKLNLALNWYIAKNHFGKLRNVEAKTESKEVNYSHDNDFIFIWYKKRYLRIAKNREKLENASSSENRFSRSYTLSGMFAKRAINSMLQTCLEEYEEWKDANRKVKKSSTVYVSNYGDWCKADSQNIKKFKDVYLENKEELINDLDKFKSNSDIYDRLKIPMKRGYLFYGPPGNGKSTLAGAIANHLKYDVYIVDLADMSSNGQFTRAMRNIPEKSVIVFEDIDATTSNREEKKKSKNDAEPISNRVSLSSVLNVLSGLSSKNDIVTVITTNHVDQLDAALIREGRCDFKMEILNPTKETVESYLSSAFSETIVLPNLKKDLSFVQLQEIVLRNINDKEACLKPLMDEQVQE